MNDSIYRDVCFFCDKILETKEEMFAHLHCGECIRTIREDVEHAIDAAWERFEP